MNFLHKGLPPSRSVPCFEQFQHACELEEGWKVSAADALFRSERDFMPGSLTVLGVLGQGNTGRKPLEGCHLALAPVWGENRKFFGALFNRKL